jgi:hypothetical protein
VLRLIFDNLVNGHYLSSYSPLSGENLPKLGVVGLLGLISSSVDFDLGFISVCSYLWYSSRHISVTLCVRRGAGADGDACFVRWERFAKDPRQLGKGALAAAPAISGIDLLANG